MIKKIKDFLRSSSLIQELVPYVQIGLKICFAYLLLAVNPIYALILLFLYYFFYKEWKQHIRYKRRKKNEVN